MRTSTAFAPKLKLAALATIAGLALAACVLDAGVPRGAKFRCDVDVDCPAGQACSAADRVCVAAGSAPPSLVAHALSPADASAGASVSFDVTASAPLSSAQLVFAGDDPGFAEAVITGDTSSFSLVVGDTDPADGFYLFDAVDLVDHDGRARRWPLDEVLHVDRAPPRTVVNVVAAPSLASDVAGGNTLTFAWSADEPLAAPPAVDVEGDADLSACDASTCTVTLGAPDDPSLASAHVIFRARDLAGNEGSTDLFVPVDFLPPSVVDVVADVHTPAGASEVTAAPGSHVDIDIVVSEPLDAIDAVTLAIDATTSPSALAATRVNDLRWRVSFDVVDVAGAGSAALGLELVDGVGHVAAQTVDDALSFSVARAGPCIVSAACADVDGDGHFAVAASCSIGDDCDDGDALVFPGMPEIPGDGVRNDCTGGADDPIDDSDGVFVDPFFLGANDGDVCVLAEPCLSLDRALAVRNGRPFIFVASGANLESTIPYGDASLVGVRADVGGAFRLARGPGLHDPQPAATITLNGAQLGGALVAGLDLRNYESALDNSPVALVADTFGNGNDPTFSGPTFIVGGRTTSPVVITSDAMRVLDSSFDRVDLSGSGLVFARSTLGAINLGAGASAEIASSFVNGAVLCSQCASIAIYQSTIVDATSQVAIQANDIGSVIDLINDIIDVSNLDSSPASRAIILATADVPALRFAGNQLSTRRSIGGEIMRTSDDVFNFGDIALFEQSPSSFPGGGSNLLAANTISESSDVAGDGNVVVGADNVINVGIATPEAAALDYFDHCFTDPPFAGCDATTTQDTR